MNWEVSPSLGTFHHMQPMDYVTVGAFVFSVAATIAAVLAARWEWLDRPLVSFRYRMEAENARKVTIENADGTKRTLDRSRDPFTAEMEVYSEGSAVLHDVAIRPAGSVKALSDTKDDVHQSRMTADSPPLTATIYLYDLEEEEREPYLEVLWTTLRPCRRHGERIHLRTHSIEKWKWSWWRWGLRKRPHEPWWMKRPVRTTGTWKVERNNPLVAIPRDPIQERDAN